MAEFIEGEWKEFVFKMADPEDYTDILVHMRNNFYRDEPLNKLAGYSDAKADDIDKKVILVLNENLSFLARHKETNKVAAVRITGAHPKDMDMTELYEKLESPEVHKILAFLMELEAQANIFETYKEIDCYADFFMVSVDREYRGKGLAEETYNRVIPMLKAKGFKLAKCIFSSPYTQRIGDKRGFKELGRKYFRDYKDKNGDMVLPGAGPEQMATITVLEL